ncbi:MAG: hypothetical protein D6820_12765, partial [Lentisphaerae bacterium]
MPRLAELGLLLLICPALLAGDGVEQLARQWRKAVFEGKLDEALCPAGRIVPATALQKGSPWQVYVELFQYSGLDPALLKSGFIAEDWRYWQDCLKLRRLALALLKDIDPHDTDAVIAGLLRGVRNRVRPVENDLQNAWPMQIWQRGYGLCDRQAWLLAELAYQLGFEVTVVYLRDAKTRVSYHTVAELRKDTQVWVVDPFCGHQLKGLGVTRLVRNMEAKQKLWPDHAQWWKTIGAATLYIPAHPFDYCLRTQLLAASMKKNGFEPPFRFGEDPRRRQLTYDRLRRKTSTGFPKLEPLGLWDYPLRLLKAENQWQASGNE